MIGFDHGCQRTNVLSQQFPFLSLPARLKIGDDYSACLFIECRVKSEDDDGILGDGHELRKMGPHEKIKKAQWAHFSIAKQNGP